MSEELKKDLEEVVAEAEAKAEELQAEIQAKSEEQERAAKALAEKMRRENPHGLIRSTVSRMPDPETVSTETMSDYAEDLEKSFKKIHAGDVMDCTVVGVDETGVTVDLNYYAPGFIPVEEISADPHFSIMEDVYIGDRFQATVTKRDDGKGNILLSRKQADDTLSWDKLTKMMEEKTVVSGKIQEVVKSGAILYVEGVRGFIPASKLSLDYVEDTSEYLNHIVEVQVINVDAEAKKLVLSAKEILQTAAIKKKNEKISRLTAGNIVEGKVETLKDYGAFVDIGEGISGLLHISQISEHRVKNIHSVLKEGQTVKVLITKVENGKVSLSMKALEEALNTEKAEEEPEEYSDHGEAATSLFDLLKNIKL